MAPSAEGIQAHSSERRDEQPKPTQAAVKWSMTFGENLSGTLTGTYVMNVPKGEVSKTLLSTYLEAPLSEFVGDLGRWCLRQHHQDGVRRKGNSSKPEGEVRQSSHEQH